MLIAWVGSGGRSQDVGPLNYNNLTRVIVQVDVPLLWWDSRSMTSLENNAGAYEKPQILHIYCIYIYIYILTPLQLEDCSAEVTNFDMVCGCVPVSESRLRWCGLVCVLLTLCEDAA